MSEKTLLKEKLITSLRSVFLGHLVCVKLATTKNKLLCCKFLVMYKSKSIFIWLMFYMHGVSKSAFNHFQQYLLPTLCMFWKWKTKVIFSFSFYLGGISQTAVLILFGIQSTKNEEFLSWIPAICSSISFKKVKNLGYQNLSSAQLRVQVWLTLKEGGGRARK